MLAKSKRSAVIMAIIFGIPMAVVALAAGQIRYARLAPEERNPNVTNGFAGIGPALMALAILVVSLGILSLVIYQLSERHYGRQGAVRWAIGGTIYGLLQQVVLTPIPTDFDFKGLSILKQIGGDLLWKAGTLVVTYLLVFPLFSWFKKRIASRNGTR